jgi:hypothetical protein
VRPGHTHQAVAPPAGRGCYYNSGCWTDQLCHYLTVNGEVVRLHEATTGEVLEGAL